jgi:hypothetical protein
MQVGMATEDDRTDARILLIERGHVSGFASPCELLTAAVLGLRSDGY